MTEYFGHTLINFRYYPIDHNPKIITSKEFKIGKETYKVAYFCIMCNGKNETLYYNKLTVSFYINNNRIELKDDTLECKDEVVDIITLSMGIKVIKVSSDESEVEFNTLRLSFYIGDKYYKTDVLAQESDILVVTYKNVNTLFF